MSQLALWRRCDYRRGMSIRFLPLLALTALAGCGMLSSLHLAPEVPAAVAPEAAPVAAPLPVRGNTPEALDQTTAAERSAATAAPDSAGQKLGTATISLGSPVEQGFWVKSALVTTPGHGRVVLASGGSVAVDLLPGAGAAQLSLAAYRALGLGLTDLPEVTIYAD